MNVVLSATDPCSADDEKSGVRKVKILLNRSYERDSGRIYCRQEGRTFDDKRLQ